MIKPDELKPEHKNSLVVYTPYSGARPEQGRITSWNEKFIFVDYDNTGRGQATPPNKLEFIYG
jgi:hypothetical protein